MQVNGDVRNPAALAVAPGHDGVSLREAVLAVNAVPGPHDVVFDPTLSGAVIHLRGDPLQLTTAGTSIAGFLLPDGSPAISIEGSGAIWPGNSGLAPAVLYVKASRTRIARLRLAGATNNYLEVVAGRPFTTPPPGWIEPPASVEDVRIEENVFDNTGYPPFLYLTALRVWMYGSVTGGRISRVSIRRNRVTGYRQSNDAGFIVSPSGKDSLIEDVTIEENEFDTTFPLELSYISGIGCSIRRTTIARNRMLNATVAMLIGTIGTRNRENVANTIEDTVIDSNEVRGELNSIDVMNFTADPEAVIRDAVTRNTIVRNNLIVTGDGLGFVAGQGGVSGSRIEGIAIVNNTIVTGPLAAVSAVSNREGASGNVVSGLEIRNTILDGPIRDQTGPEDEIEGEIALAQIFRSITKLAQFGGVNGNIVAAAQFADREAGDFRLPAGSPAIGTADEAFSPPVDLDCRTRVGLPDIGAYEFATIARPRLTVLVEAGGAVSTLPAGLSCGGKTTKSYAQGEVVQLTATPVRTFAGWSGDPDCSDGFVTMDRDHVCIATFRESKRRRAVRH